MERWLGRSRPGKAGIYEKATSNGGYFFHSYPILGSYLHTIRPNTEAAF
jgi:hypothetical protein